MTVTALKDYRLSPLRDPQIERSIETIGWYATPIARKDLKELARRNDRKAGTHFLIWAAALVVAAGLALLSWGTWWAVPAFLAYGIVYNSADSKWHELSHGTPFSHHGLNEALYRIVSVMTLREPVRWRWSHARHHTHTIIVGHDPEIASPRPPHVVLSILGLWYLRGFFSEISLLLTIAAGSIPATVKSYVPEREWPAMILSSRVFLGLLLVIGAACVVSGSILPAMFIGLPRFYGSFLHYSQAFTQHAGLDEDVLDHRLNARTVLMNPVFCFLYTNMNYHVEHHMFPMVPFYNLPALHRLIRHDTPAPYCGLRAAYAEIIPTLWRQRRDPAHYAIRQLPEGAGAARPLPRQYADGAVP